MTVQDDLDDLAARVDGLVAQVAIGYGEEPLADAVRSVLGLNREALVEKAARASHQWGLDFGGEHAEWDALRESTRREYREEAAAVVDALLPQVTTIDELEALPVGAQVLDGSGVVWRAWRWTLDYQMFFYSSVATFGAYEAAEVLARGPLTIVWRP